VNLPIARRGASPLTFPAARKAMPSNVPPEPPIEKDDKEEKLMYNVLRFTRSRYAQHVWWNPSVLWF
jgi:hypothetical protein